MFNLDIVNQKISLENSTIELWIKREDLNHPFISGNKYRKVKYNIEEAKEQGLETLLTFGGAYSNHIAAVAYAGKEYGFKTIGVIRGDELQNKVQTNPTLDFAESCGMQFKFVTREHYRQKTSESFIENLKTEFGSFYLLPEGGTNKYAIKGCEEILTKEDSQFDYICSAVGTGGTISGLINSTANHQTVIGFPALKGDFLKHEIKKWTNNTNWELNTNYHFGGYAKINSELVEFINMFKSDFGIPLDPVYTGKMLFGIFDMIKKEKFKKGSKILAIHTGGLQGIVGMNQMLKAKNMQLIK
ncbi:MAG: pyridoxal-phosphate dependent enzyme [Bacteroidia bacterium]|nr:pyridoxal-phosphate dependent enzyme [Bacteroidia bacterium]